MSEKLVQKPFKASVWIVAALVAIIGIVLYADDAAESFRSFRQSRAAKQAARAAQEAADRALQAARRPVPETIEFVLRPGERIVIETNGNRFDYFFSGRTEMGLFRGRYAKETISFWQTSRENQISRARMSATQAVEFIRPRDARTPLGYKVTVYRVPQL